MANQASIILFALLAIFIERKQEKRDFLFTLVFLFSGVFLCMAWAFGFVWNPLLFIDQLFHPISAPFLQDLKQQK